MKLIRSAAATVSGSGDISGTLGTNLSNYDRADLAIFLSNTAAVSSASNTVYNTPADLSTANGYTAGGVSIGTIAGAQSAGTFSFSGAA